MNGAELSRQQRRAAERRAAGLERRATELRRAARDWPTEAKRRAAGQYRAVPGAAAAPLPAPLLSEEEDWDDTPEALPDGPVTRAFRESLLRSESDDDVDDEASLVYQMRSRSPRTFQTNEASWRIVLRAHLALGVRATVPMTRRRASNVLSWCSNNGYAFGTIRNVRTVIGLMHKYAGLEDPCVSSKVQGTLSGIANTIGTESIFAKKAITVEELREMVLLAQAQRQPMRALLDEAILLVLFSSAMRRSELAALARADADFQDAGVEFRIARSKTSPTSAASVWVERSGLETCPVAALERWVRAAGVRKGPLFRHVDRRGNVQPRPVSTKYLERMVARYTGALGLDASAFGCHSFRAGLITTVLETGAMSEEQLMAHTRQKQVDTLLRYYRPRDRRKLNLTQAVGL